MRGHIARLCENLVHLRRYAKAEGLSSAVNGLVDDARAGEDIGARLTDLLRRLGGPEDSQPFRKVPGVILPGLPAGHTAAEVYICPSGLCLRSWLRRPGEPIPMCEIERFRLRREQG
jgi:hypothetical protein